MDLKQQFIFKAKEKLWRSITNIFENTKFYPLIFSSYWHYLFHKKKEYLITKDMYFTCRPNPFAGIGHQMANWISGYWWARRLGINFAHMPFSTQKWEEFLGFGFNEPLVSDLRKSGYKLKKLPAFYESDNRSIDFVKKIIASYKDKKVIFWPPQDHGYKDQYGILEDLKRKFNQAPYRINDRLVYNKKKFNIAIHVRRTVVIEGKVIFESDEAKALRWLSNDYYEKVLKQVLENISIVKPIVVHIFSTAQLEEFEVFKKYGQIYWGNSMNEYETFLHLIRADLLITSKSSFSYKPALISDGIKVCPQTFWHGYPDSPDFILVDNDGHFDVDKFKKCFIK